jgi:hypothetical protein
MTSPTTLFVTLCEAQSKKASQRLIKDLPPKLRTLAKTVAESNLDWEYRHFWNQNAELYTRQLERTKKIKGSWSDLHDDLFEDWNKSEHAGVFLQRLNKKPDMALASKLALKKLEDQLKEIVSNIFSPKIKNLKIKNPIFELGQFPVEARKETIYLTAHKKIEFVTWDKTNQTIHLKKIIKALSLIKTYSPKSFEYFCEFTKRIIPIKQKELVSYSLQSLPMHSFINLYDRDFLDLLDDLLHENGHHQLNLFLIIKKPLIELPDLIYYSPWRRTRRPIRGIYHAHLTFYFAQKLFFDLAQALDSKELVVSQRIKQKIYFRFCEEALMLDYSAVDIKGAIRRKIISPEGAKLFNQFENDRKKMNAYVSIAQKKLPVNLKNQLIRLSETLKKEIHP